MYYKIDLNNYKPREVPEYQEFTNYNDIKWEQIEMISKELDNFKDSFGKDLKEHFFSDNLLRSIESLFLIDNKISKPGIAKGK